MNGVQYNTEILQEYDLWFIEFCQSHLTRERGNTIMLKEQDLGVRFLISLSMAIMVCPVKQYLKQLLCRMF